MTEKIQNMIKNINSYEEACELFNSGIFNVIAQKYARITMEEQGIDEDTIHNVVQGMRFMFERKSAETVLFGEDK